jgi:hypothetical protein
VTPDTPEYRDMPLTLAFAPEQIDDEESPLSPLVLIQPSMEEEGRIFIGVNPFGKAVGCHVLPDEARRIRDHLSKLLLDSPEDASERVQAAVEAQKAKVWTRDELEAYRERRRLAAVEPTPQPSKKRRHGRKIKLTIPGLHFRIEFRFGKLQGIVARVHEP